MIILLHTSKTMRLVGHASTPLRSPLLINQTRDLAGYMATLSIEQLMRVMHISPTLAAAVAEKYTAWSKELTRQSPAIDSFIGDIYSGLQAGTFDEADREYADAHLRILSGLYGILRPLDGISPYRLEMGYRLPAKPYANLYAYWGDAVAKTLPDGEVIINLAAVEYSRLVTPFVDNSRIISPRFLTRDTKTQEPVFVVVHAKIARGAFARWLIASRVTSVDKLPEFSDIGYRFDETLSTSSEPVFICDEFGGKGLSMRLT